MPAKDRYHDTVKRALEKDGWHITGEQHPLIIEDRRIYIDILAKRDNTQAIFVEVKVFGDVPSPINYFEQTIGQHVFYRGILAYLRLDLPLYMAVPIDAFEGFLALKPIQYVLRYIESDLLVFNPFDEEVMQWVSYKKS